MQRRPATATARLPPLPASADAGPDRPGSQRPATTSDPARRSWAPGESWAASLAALAVPALGFVLFMSTGRDDAYLTYWAARTLSRTGEIVNYDGRHVEQSSSLLHTLLLAGLNRLTTVSIPALGLWVGVVSGALAAVLAARLAARIDRRAAPLAAVLTATAPYLVYWAFGGLESALAAATLVAALLAAAWTFQRPTRRAVTTFVLSAAAFLMVRPEAGLVLVCVGAGALVVGALRTRWSPGESRTLRGPVVILATSVVGSLLLVAFREWYFGMPVPQPVRAKTSGVQLRDGVDYLRLWLGHVWVLPVALAVVAGVVVAVRRRSWPAVLVVLGLTAGLGFVLLTGGDWMEAGRFLVPVLPLAAILAAVAVQPLRRPARWAASTLLVLAQLYGVGWVAADVSTGRPAWASAPERLPAADRAVVARLPWYERANRVHAREAVLGSHLAVVVDELIRARGHVTIASGQAGMVPYYLLQSRMGKVRFVDRGSLSGDDFAACSDAMVRVDLGAGLPLAYWLSHARRCGVPVPDVLYDVGVFPREPAEARAFTLVYQEPSGSTTTSSRRFAGVPVDNAEFIAVRNDLVSLLPSR